MSRGEAEPADDGPPPRLRTAFWYLVILANLSVFALALGLMLIGFRGQWGLGGGVFIVGVAGTVVLALRYRSIRAKLASGDLSSDSSDVD